jgi:5-oxoprolinase (ATP-hydrolysing)
LRAQVAANQKGAEELRKMVAFYGLPIVRACMSHVQDNAEEAVRRVIGALKDGAFAVDLDNGACIQVALRVDPAARSVEIDFTVTSGQLQTISTPLERVHGGSAVRVPHAGRRCESIERRLPQAAEGFNTAGLDAQSACLGRVGQRRNLDLHHQRPVRRARRDAASQGTMNNLTFGNARYQYYETIPGGSGADLGRDGGVPRTRFMEPTTAGILSNNRVHAPFGMAGGAPGKSAQFGRASRGACRGAGQYRQGRDVAGVGFVVETQQRAGFAPGDTRPEPGDHRPQALARQPCFTVNS